MFSKIQFRRARLDHATTILCGKNGIPIKEIFLYVIFVKAVPPK